MSRDLDQLLHVNALERQALLEAVAGLLDLAEEGLGRIAELDAGTAELDAGRAPDDLSLARLRRTFRAAAGRCFPHHAQGGRV